MAEDEAKGMSKGSKFLKKSKWGKIFKEDDRQGRFTLNDDVTDFLKPSTEKQVPKLDIAIAKRWPDAHEVRAAMARNDSQEVEPDHEFRYLRPRRREGLTVGFAKTPPQVIGEGGEEALEPTREISRKRIMFSRSISEKTPRPLADGTAWPGSQPTVPGQRQPAPASIEEQHPKLRRAMTQNEFSPAVQARMTSQTHGQHDNRFGGSGRAAPDFDSRRDHRPQPPEMSGGFPGIVVDSVHDSNEDTLREGNAAHSDYDDITQDPGFASQAPYARGGVKKQYLGLAAPESAASPVYRKSRDMSLSEGMAFRRASSMIFKDDDDENDGQALHLVKPAFEQPPPPVQQPVQPARNVVADMPSPPSESSTSPTSAVSPSGPSPFEDPKYIKRHSGQGKFGTAPVLSQPRPAAQARPFEDPRYIKNFSRGPQSAGGPGQSPRSHISPPQSTAGEQPQTRSRPDPKFPIQSGFQERTQPPGPPRVEMQSEHRIAPQINSSLDTRGQHFSPQKSMQPQRPHRPEGMPSHMPSDQPPPNQYRPSPPQIIPPPAQETSKGSWEADLGSSRRNQQRPEGSAMPYRHPQPPGSMQNVVPQIFPSRENSLVPSRDESRGSSMSPDRARQTGYANGSSPHLNKPHSNPHSRNASQDDIPSSTPYGRSAAQAPSSPRFMTQPPVQSPQAASPRSLFPEQHTSSSSPGSRTSPAESAIDPRRPSVQSSRGQPVAPRPDERHRPGPTDPVGTDARVSPASQAVNSSPQSHDSNPAADAAFSNFARRVAHMKGVFRLTAEREQPADRCAPSMWVRTATWWFLRGKAGLEALVQQRRSQGANEAPRELLTQAHVDVAKAWWIVTDPLEQFDPAGGPPPGSESDRDNILRQVSNLCFHLKSISLSMGKTGLMPPTDSLIQGQDTSIWLAYPRFAPDAAAVLGGAVTKSIIVNQQTQIADTSDVIPLADSRDTFCYGRFRVEAHVNTEDANTDRTPLPCLLSIVRSKRDYQTTILVASQSDLINVRVGPRQSDTRGLSWQEVSWKASSFGLIIHLPHGFDLSIRMQERDFRPAWNLIEYARKVDQSLYPERDEKPVYEVRLAELQYSDSSNSTPFPPDKMRGCKVLVFERFAQYTDGSGTRKMHRGFRLLLITDAAHKTLSNASHDLCQNAPLFFEFLTDSAGNGPVAMVIRVREEKRQCRILLVFPDAASRQQLYDVLNSITVGADETVIGRMALASYNIEPATQTEGFTAAPHPALQALQWQKLSVTNLSSDDPNSRVSSTVESERLRIVARHGQGCITDRLNLGKGELLLRLPCVDRPAVQLLRQAQEDMSMSVDIRNAAQPVVDGIGQLFNAVVSQPTIRTLTFATPTDLHDFQVCVTGFTVRYDGIASSFGISRRRMVVPIYKKWEASKVRLQVVARESVVQVLAFMEDFSHADAMCFQVKSMDTFENIKGDGKNRKWAVKMVDAKFSLPRHEKSEVEGPERVKRRFVNLEGLDYAEEHDDITIGFDTERDRDRFAQALPAATSVSRGITLKRRI